MTESLLNAEGWEALANIRLRRLEEVNADNDRLLAQLPADMQDCTILFKECEVGHGRLTAMNWIDHGCRQCEMDRLTTALQKIADLVDSEADEPLDDAIAIANAALGKATAEGGMNNETLEALKGSIAKWEAIVAGTGKDDGPLNCPLCQMFHYRGLVKKPEEETCVGCPVMAATGKTLCRGTPYDEINEYDPSEDLAREELEFLKALLPLETVP